MAFLEHDSAAEVLIHSGNVDQFIDPHVDGERKTRGLIPRDYARFPRGYSGMHAVDIPTTPRSEWSRIIKDMTASKSRLSDIRNKGNNGQRIPSRDQNGKGYCTPPGTRIRLADGSVKKIEDVKLLDKVLSAEGNVRRVMECYVRRHVGDMVTVRMWGHNHLQLTPNHEVLTKRGYVPAGDLQSGDLVAVPRFAPQTSAVIQTSEHTVGLKRKSFTAVVGKPEWVLRQPYTGERGYVPVPDFIRMTKGAGRVIGLWLAEGHIDHGKRQVVWSFSTDERETLVTELVSLLQAEFGVEADVREGPASETVTQVVVSGTLWCQLFVSLCREGAGGKKLHGDLMSGPLEFLDGMFTGWMDGDGCARGRYGAYRCGTTISHDLALAMYDVANALGYNPSIAKEKPQKNKYAKTRRPPWKVFINPEPSGRSKNYRFEADEKTVWRKVRQVDRAKYDGMVYNFAVEGDNSYVAEGIGVHNCWMHSGVAAVIYLRAKMGQPYVSLSAYAGACIIKQYRDEGGWGAQGVDFLRERGIPSEEFWPQQSMSRSNDRPETWTNAALHKVTDGWYDLEVAQYDRRLSFDQVMTCLLNRIPVVSDYNWWGHSVCAIDPVDGVSLFDAGRLRTVTGKLMSFAEFHKVWEMDDEVAGGFGVRIQNSWGDGWSDAGTGTLAASKAVPDGSVAPWGTLASVA